MLTCIFAAARREGVAALPYARMMLRAGLTGCIARLHSVSPELATIFLDVPMEQANLTDRFLLVNCIKSIDCCKLISGLFIIDYYNSISRKRIYKLPIGSTKVYV